MKWRREISLMKISPVPGEIGDSSTVPHVPRNVNYSHTLLSLPTYVITRNQLKASYLMSSEVQSTVAEDIGMQVCV